MYVVATSEKEMVDGPEKAGAGVFLSRNTST
jgi:hypothetical protein